MFIIYYIILIIAFILWTDCQSIYFEVIPKQVWFCIHQIIKTTVGFFIYRSIVEAIPGTTFSIVPLNKLLFFSLFPKIGYLFSSVPCSPILSCSPVPLPTSVLIPLFLWNKCPFSMLPQIPGRASRSLQPHSSPIVLWQVLAVQLPKCSYLAQHLPTVCRRFRRL